MKILVHAHVYYPNIWPEIRCCITNLLQYPCEIYITTPSSDPAVISTIKKDFPSSHLIVTKNSGFDIAPFLDVINKVDLSSFDYIAKLHTKRSVSCIKNNLFFIGGQWRKKLLAPFSRISLLQKSLNQLESNSRIGMIAHPSVIFAHDHPEITLAADVILKELGLVSISHRFVAGTMFLARTNALLPLLIKPPTISKDTAYIFERALGFTVSALGYKISDPNNHLWLYESTYMLRGYLISLSRFLFRITIKPFAKNNSTIQQLSNL